MRMKALQWRTENDLGDMRSLCGRLLFWVGVIYRVSPLAHNIFL